MVVELGFKFWADPHVYSQSGGGVGGKRERERKRENSLAYPLIHK